MIWVFIVLFSIGVGGCASSQKAGAPSSFQIDSIYLTKLVRDSIFVRDSVIVKEKGDTVFLDKYKYVYRYVLRHDTMNVVKIDSVKVPFPVEAKLTRWEKLKIDVGGGAIIGVSFAIIIAGARFLYKLRV